MRYLRLHSWKVAPSQAAKIQIRLRERFEGEDRVGRVKLVAGADVAFDLPRKRAIAGVVVFEFPGMREVERAWATRPLRFPYVPGLLSFREIPALLAAFARLKREPDLIFCDAQGYAHPRRFGLACHLGVLLDRPSIGCAKSILLGDYEEPAEAAGSWAPLRHQGEIVGAALRTCNGVKPIYISQGHRVSLRTALCWTRAVCDGYRIPRPTREADHFVEEVKHQLTEGPHPNGKSGKRKRR